MAVRSSQYGKEMDKSPAGKSVMAQHKRAVRVSSTTTEEDKYDKPSLMNRVMLGMMKLGGGTKTQRTKTVEAGMKQAGLTDKEVARFQRGKDSEREYKLKEPLPEITRMKMARLQRSKKGK